MKNKAAKLKSKRKGTENAFGCDLTDHLQTSGQDVPYVLKTCAEFIEKHGIVDGIYRLSGITSNIQKLRLD
uniref:Rho GTPase activating protein 31 n=1 Tax=Sinocyclocheilus grahami TaxID=75366 RepID=A0A672LR24_SINGR